MNDYTCPSCGMPRDEWPDDRRGGFEEDGKMYCCEGCATGSGCTCRAAGQRAPTQEEIREDAASGEFVQSLQHETKHVGPEDYGTERVAPAPQRDYGPA
jgi:hypothetical protein